MRALGTERRRQGGRLWMIGLVMALIAAAAVVDAGPAQGQVVTLDMRVLVIAADGNEPEYGAITNTLERIGVPFDTLYAASAPLTTAMLTDGAGNGNYSAIVLTSGHLWYYDAAALGVHYVVDRPVETVHANVAGTESVLSSAHRHGRRVLLTSTSEVYGKGSRVPFTEDDDVVLGATSRSRWCYAASKMLDEFLGLGYHQQFGLPVTAVRLFNTVGPRQTGRYGMVVPRFV